MKTISDYLELGYRFEILATGYSVWHGDIYIGGAGVLNPVESYSHMHWRTRIANIEDNKKSALAVARDHYNRSNKL